MIAFLTRLIANLWLPRQRQRGDRVPRATFRPRLEALEGREFLSAGSLDLAFGPGGTVLTGFAGIAEAHAVAIQPNDHKIVVAGTTHTPGPDDFAHCRQAGMMAH
jgi:hypothetical protein